MNSEIGYAILSILGLILVSAFFSGAETGLTATSRARLTEIERRGSKRADGPARTSDRVIVVG
jgi:Mg2+/Co2+ transporter CorB